MKTFLQFALLAALVLAAAPGCAAQTIAPSLFCAGFNKFTSTWYPWDGNSNAAQIYCYRLWDDGVKWSQVQPTNVTPTWTTMDAHIITRARGNNTQAGENIAIGAPGPGTPMAVTYTFGAMPQFASVCNGLPDPGTCLPGPTASGFGGGAQCSSPPGDGDFGCTPPSDVNADGTGADAFYSTIAADIATRYVGEIQYYEIWNEADSANFWCIQGAPAGCGGGNPQTTANTPSLSRLVRMGWDLKHIIGCLDPAAKILSPSFHVATALTWFHNYNITSVNAPAGVSGVNGVPIGCNWSAQTVTGKMTYDYVNVHARGTQAASPDPAGNWNPAAMITAYNNTVTEIANDSLPNPTVIFNNEFGFNGSVEGGGNVDNYAAYTAQSYIFCAALGFAQCYWYQWDTTGIGPNGTLQGTAYDVTALQLIGSTIAPCAKVGTIWTCAVMKAGVSELYAWDTSQNCTTGCTTLPHVFGVLYTSYIDLVGASHLTTGGNGTAPLGSKPILLQQMAAPVAPGGMTGSGSLTGSGSIL